MVREVEKFSHHYELDPADDLLIHWIDPTENPRLLSWTDGPNEAHVASCPLLTHELVHVFYWRTTGDGDANHEIPPGPWTNADNEKIHDIEGDVCAPY